MKVPPNKHIVCAIPPQAILRQSVLAAVSYVMVLCGAACVQSALAAPSLILWNAVEISYGTESEQTCTLQRSSDLHLWTDVDGAVFGDGDVNEVMLSTAGTASRSGFFRLRVDARPALGNSRWSMAGCRMLINKGASPSKLIFLPDAGGTMIDGDRLTPFKWGWHRTGLDDGQVTVTWADDVVEIMDFHFLGLYSGVFSSQRMTGGLPAGALSGTFQDEASAAPAPGIPASMQNVLVTLSGTGRPLGIEIKADGTALRPGATENEIYACRYAVTDGTQAELTLAKNGTDRETYSLTFSGPSCGKFSVQSFRDGLLRRSSEGTFAIAPR